MPPTVVSPTHLHQTSSLTSSASYATSDMVLESSDTNNGQNNVCNPLQWIYMPMNHTNDTVPPPTKFPSAWRPFPTAQTYPYNCGAYQNGLSSPVPASSPSDFAFDLCDRFNDLNLLDCYSKSARFNRIPPDNYLCHLCFLKGHYIRDCPQVRLSKHITKHFLTLFITQSSSLFLISCD